MSDLLFSDSGHVSIEGARVLRFLNRSDACVEYLVLGFAGKVILRDFRLAGLKAIDYVLSTQDTSYFSDDFNGRAHISVFDWTEEQPMVIKLEDTAFAHRYLLLIMVGFDGYIPAYEFEVSVVQKTNDKEFALIAVAEIDQNEMTARTHSSPSESSCDSSFRSRADWAVAS